MIFKDEVYDDMDWLEKACVPIVCELNEVLGEIPDEIVLDYGMILKHGCSYGPSSITADSVLNTIDQVQKLEYDDIKKVIACFDVVVEGEPILDLEAQTLLGGKVKIVKIKESFEEKEIEEMIGVKGISSHLRRLSHRDVSTDRLNDMLELLGLFEARRLRSSKQKLEHLVSRMNKIMKDNEWDIRDVKLSNRVSFWISKYLVDGNLAAYTNFCKLKVMTHEESPIYSVEGEEPL